MKAIYLSKQLQQIETNNETLRNNVIQSKTQVASYLIINLDF